MKQAIRMYIDKFGGEVLIDSDHPLAVAQLAKNAAAAESVKIGENAIASGEHTATHSEDATLAAATVAHAPDALPHTGLAEGSPAVGAPDVKLPPAGDEQVVEGESVVPVDVAFDIAERTSIEIVAAKLTEKPIPDLLALAKEAGLDVEASYESLVADLAILIDGGLIGFDGVIPVADKGAE